ncbi:MAG: S9 family peptidase [Acidobacteria bacterium]|jgi:oligopeptidase B|nr:S9 family peptidase [Acidobacteriota bacterium]
MAKKHLFFIFILLIFVFGSGNLPEPPVAEKIAKELTYHDHTRIDYYYWLQERQNPKVREYLDLENKYTGAVMKKTALGKLQQKLYAEITARIKPDDQTVPYQKNGYLYYQRFLADKDYAIYCRKKSNSGSENKVENKEEILLDINEMAKGQDFYYVQDTYVSPDNNLLAFSVDTMGRRKYAIQFKILDKGKIMTDNIPGTTGEVAWANDNQTIFYAVKDDDTLRPYKIMKHRLNQPIKDDILIFKETDATFNLSVYNSRSNRYVFIASESTLATEYRFLDMNQPDSEFSVIQPREKDLAYSIDHMNDKFYIRTNWKAKNFRLMETPVTCTTKEHWIEVIPYCEDVFLQKFEIFKNYLALKERNNGRIQIKIVNRENLSRYCLEFPGAPYNADIDYNPEIDTDILIFTYNSLVTPDSTFAYNMKTGDRQLLKQDAILGNYQPGNYESELRYVFVRDGARVPVSLVYRKGLVLNGNNPLLLEGYGAYGSSFDPEFSAARISLLDRGFVYALAHIRGGQELGRDWYENGKMLKKKNTFNDFIDCAQYLIKEKFTNPNKLFAVGASAGGLLMGAVTTMAPELFKGIIAEVPWMDVVTCMLDESIPLVTVEFDEWGNPKNKEYYDYLLSYSPYDNIQARNYPAMLVTTGFHDSQVQYWDPAKWVAKLRDKKTGNNILLFSIDMHAGHSGTTGRFRSTKEIAMEYAFMLYLLGMH